MRSSRRPRRPSGLPPGQMGNSEVGHLNLGAGRPVLPDLQRHRRGAVRRHCSTTGAAILAACQRAARPGRSLHLISLVGPGGVHANDRHLVAMADLARRRSVGEVRVHALLDGRDSARASADLFVPDLERRLAAVHPDARIATVGGRYYGWTATSAGSARRRRTPRSSTARGTTQRPPRRHRRRRTREARPTSSSSRPSSTAWTAASDDGDAVIHANYRADRARQLTHALADREFEGYRPSSPTERCTDGLPRRDVDGGTRRGCSVEVAFPPEIAHSLAEELSGLGSRPVPRRRDREYAHARISSTAVDDGPWPGEERRLIPKPQGRDVRPRARDERRQGVTDALVAAIDPITTTSSSRTTQTPTWSATPASGLPRIRPSTTIDRCLGRIVKAVESARGARPPRSGRCCC